jgi:Xaa-Pro aminopeptidase
MNVSFPSPDDLQIRYTRLQALLRAEGAEACCVRSAVNLYYLTGYVFDGYVYLEQEGGPLIFVRKAGVFEPADAISIRKPEEIPDRLRQGRRKLPDTLALEAGVLTHNEYLRLQAVFGPEKTVDATPLLRRSRMIKTPWEIGQLRYSAARHDEVYRECPALFSPGMTDLEWQYEMERALRRRGSIGIFRAFGGNMDIFMGSVLTGENAAKPSPFDFALGGGGVHSSLPIGADGSRIREGQSVMVDMAGNFTAYLTDMTRVYALGTLPDEAYRAHETSVDLHRWLRSVGRPGLPCADIYEQSVARAGADGFGACFMGVRQQASFVGHGIGIEINEWPVLAARSQDVLAAGMVFAFEPKFVLPGVGAVGVENTYLVTESGIEQLTLSDEGIVGL